VSDGGEGVYPVEGDVETILHQLLDVIGNARPMPLSASVMVNRDEVLEIIEAALARLPEELRSARWLLREREEFLAKVQREGDDILDAARARAERMVQRTEVVRAAQHTARRLVEEAEAEARRLRHEAEDYCDHKLAQFEIVLDRTIKTVQAGRARLHTPVEEPQPQPRYAEQPAEELYDHGEE
jgi:cell division septum initiation protein DivIVA